LAGSYLFYAWVDWRFLVYLIIISGFNYYIGIAIEKSKSKRKRNILFAIALLQGIGSLVFFKYYNFIIPKTIEVLNVLKIPFNLNSLHILIPLGISFFTFRTLSYCIDIYKEKNNAIINWVSFFNYISFFPTLISGPIDKTKEFIPQLETKRIFEYDQAVDGLRQILWGVFKKIVIADNCIPFTNELFNNYEKYKGTTLFFGAFLYSIQLYTDFSGYSDIAIGISRLLGFKVPKNFDFPFFSHNIAEFWRKWHISLSNWLTEYVFTPLSIQFRDFGKTGLIIAILINFTIIGMWHGAHLNFVFFGLYHGCLFIPLILWGTLQKWKHPLRRNTISNIKEFVQIISTFMLVIVSFILFKANGTKQALSIIHKIVTDIVIKTSFIETYNFITRVIVFKLLVIIIIFFVSEWFQRKKSHGLQINGINLVVVRWCIYEIIIVLILLFGAFKNPQFIYFNF
jgi:D-alanyl-lipoteichoic acid acyltransferase DltB (MBOAT superfamily)